jgi:hypothetical protein
MRCMTKTLICAAAPFALLIAHAAKPPQVKEGLWSIHTQSIDNPPSAALRALLLFVEGPRAPRSSIKST